MKKFLLFTMVLAAAAPSHAAADDITCWFPPGWESKGDRIRSIVDALAQGAGVTVQPRVASSYPRILDAFAAGGPDLVYAGSFVQSIILSRNLGTPLVQVRDGKEFYAGIMVHPKGQDPAAILRDHGARVAFAVGASSGESSAKAATNGKAAFRVASHAAAAGAVAAGKAAAAFVKNWWWASHRNQYPALTSWSVPGVSEEKNPDNILTASKGVPKSLIPKITDAAIRAKDDFGADTMVSVTPDILDFSLSLMKAGNIDPLAYAW